MTSDWIEMVIEGPPGWTRGFIEGHLCGSGSESLALDAEAEGFDVAPLRERLGELLRPSRAVTHMLVPARLAAEARAAIAAATARDGEVTLRSQRSIAAARFAFSFEVFAREHGARIRGFFDPLPAGIALAAGSSFEETTHPDDAGIELFAPAHDYELRARGVVVGEVGAVVALYRRCRAEELIRVDPAELIEAAPS